MLKILNETGETSTLAPLNTRVDPYVRIINGALDEDPESASGIVLNGRIDTETLRFLKIDAEYQRPLGERSDIFEALKEGTIVPNIDVGVRGQDFTAEGDDFVIRSPAYIIDGWQRVGTALRLLELIPNHPVRIFATVHFGTTDLWERHRFTELNKNVKKVSPNLHLRNMRDTNEAVLTLYGLCNNTREFPLFKKVSWSQNMHRGDLMPANLVAKIMRRLHARLAGLSGMNTEAVAQTLLAAARAIGLNQFRKNVLTFYETIEECWGLRNIEFRHASPQLKSGFQAMLARMFNEHLDFWDPSERIFFVSSDGRRKLAKFPLSDPHIANLAGSGGASLNILYEMLCTHMDSGKRTGRMRPRPPRRGT